MPATQPPYDATRISMRQTLAHMGIFRPFTSIAGETGASGIG
jgi:hypothetical protein